MEHLCCLSYSFLDSHGLYIPKKLLCLFTDGQIASNHHNRDAEVSGNGSIDSCFRHLFSVEDDIKNRSGHGVLENAIRRASPRMVSYKNNRVKGLVYSFHHDQWAS